MRLLLHTGYVWLFRTGLFVGLLSAVLTVIYLTPYPDMTFASCDRPCHELDWPMICRYTLTFELHQSMGGWCGDCPNNLSHCYRPGCVVADGNSKRIMAVNKKLPGTKIEVCENDILLIDVVNRVPGQSVSLHWRGQLQIGTPYMDGVPMITQCPITTYTTFQYKFRAAHHGTHLWHAHTGNELLDGIFGALVVRRSKKMEEIKHFYDEDVPDHILVISEWSDHNMNKINPVILINGIAENMKELTPKLLVNHGRRYRIRVAFAGGITGCPIFINVEGHPLFVVAIDGNYISPRNVSSVLITPGERIDFILAANQHPEVYSLRAESNCTTTSGIARIEYNQTNLIKPNFLKSITETKSYKMSQLLSTVQLEDCRNRPEAVVCLPEIYSHKKGPASLSKKLNMKLYLPFDIVHIAGGKSDLGDAKPRMNNITFIFPPSPLLSQPENVEHSDLVCHSHKIPASCMDNSATCECVHVIDIPLGSRVELILVDKDVESEGEHIFHLHGYKFYVLGISNNIAGMTVDEIKSKDHKGTLFKRNLINPPLKDTITIPKGGAVSIRFLADNPGYWLLHDQSTALWASGMDIVLKVGDQRDLPSVPDNFPRCGNWVGPHFLLI